MNFPHIQSHTCFLSICSSIKRIIMKENRIKKCICILSENKRTDGHTPQHQSNNTAKLGKKKYTRTEKYTYFLCYEKKKLI